MQYILYKCKIYFTFLEICESRGRTPPKRDVAENIQKGARRFVRAGRYNPSLKLCVAICKTLGVTLNDLFWDDDAS